MNNFNEYTLTFTAHVVAKAGSGIDMAEVNKVLQSRLTSVLHEKALVGATKVTIESFE
jgi:hypothetical protein